MKVDDCVTVCPYHSAFVVQTKHRCCFLICLMIIRVAQLSVAPLLTSLLLCNWSVTPRDTHATEFTPTRMSSLYSSLNGCMQWHYATQVPFWLVRALSKLIHPLVSNMMDVQKTLDQFSIVSLFCGHPWFSAVFLWRCEWIRFLRPRWAHRQHSVELFMGFINSANKSLGRHEHTLNESCILLWDITAHIPAKYLSVHNVL